MHCHEACHNTPNHTREISGSGIFATELQILAVSQFTLTCLDSNWSSGIAGRLQGNSTDNLEQFNRFAAISCSISFLVLAPVALIIGNTSNTLWSDFSLPNLRQAVGTKQLDV